MPEVFDVLDPVFWTLVALVIFVGIVLKAGVPKMITRGLDDRASRIARELDEAKRLREEAAALLAEYQRRARSAEQEAAEIVERAKADALRLRSEAETQLADAIERRTKAAEAKIAQAEARALADVRSVAADVAIAAAQKMLSGEVKGEFGAELLKKSIEDVRARLN